MTEMTIVTDEFKLLPSGAPWRHLRYHGGGKLSGADGDILADPSCSAELIDEMLTMSGGGGAASGHGFANGTKARIFMSQQSDAVLKLPGLSLDGKTPIKPVDFDPATLFVNYAVNLGFRQEQRTLGGYGLFGVEMLAATFPDIPDSTSMPVVAMKYVEGRELTATELEEGFGEQRLCREVRSAARRAGLRGIPVVPDMRQRNFIVSPDETTLTMIDMRSGLSDPSLGKYMNLQAFMERGQGLREAVDRAVNWLVAQTMGPHIA